MAEIQPIPDRATFMARVNGRFRSLGRRTIEIVRKTISRSTRVAKKAGKWAFALAPVQWVWTKAIQPTVRFTTKYVIKPVSVGFGAWLAMQFGAKVLVLMSGLAGTAALLLLIWLIRRNRKAKQAGFTEVTDVVTPIETKRVTKTTTVVTETVEGEDEAVEEVTEVTETVAAVEPVEPTMTETVEVEAPAESAKGNGYSVRLPEGNLNINETLEQRFGYLDGLINAEMAKPEADQDPEYICELQGRQNLIHVRAGKHSGIKKDASVAEIHRDFRDTLKDQWKADHPEETYTNEAAGIYPTALNRGAMAENGRFNKIARAKEAANKPRGKKAA
jgi:hypothetical protein